MTEKESAINPTKTPRKLISSQGIFLKALFSFLFLFLLYWLVTSIQQGLERGEVFGFIIFFPVWVIATYWVFNIAHPVYFDTIFYT